MSKKMVAALRSRLYDYGWNAAGAADRFIHVRLQLPGRPHPSPRSFESVRAGDCAHHGTTARVGFGDQTR